ncbi:GNAT family N-acetyltransferase [Nocardia sp. NEAU-G5]|uniref:GNAT family N-acetyltransferase n=1 Tax=Nocardia albiluteola TaxID=2842303 RepID=A0ABS6AWB9_9NOCA|nr:GNAT family N-acetyltransferase [Nocardia albiluteola]MBU3061270.1 GNAT family N-acetyltransferase [Nocardia albiluteola]
MTSTSGMTLRSGTAADADEVRLLTGICFGAFSDPDEIDREFELFPLEDWILVHDDERLVGAAAARRQLLTVPGGRAVEVAALANVVVAPTHRRRGILRTMYVEQHRRTEADGLPLTIFTASQGGIYGRFGYGPAVVAQHIRFDRRFAQFHPEAPDPGGVTIAPISVARQVVPALYDRWRRLVPGAQARPEPSWNWRFEDLPRLHGGGSALAAFVHDDGYALYRYHRRESGNSIEVVELRAVTAEAHAALWRALAALELNERIEAVVAPDDPLPHLFTDARLVRTTGRFDGLWLRPMDVPAALTARTYRDELDVVVAVRDPFRDAGGAFALRIRDGIAECAPTSRPADIDLGLDVLGALYLGAHRARVLAAAGRIQAKDAAHLRALDAAFETERDPVLGWFF